MKDGLGDRIKKYESIYERYFLPKTPIIIRVVLIIISCVTISFGQDLDQLLNLNNCKVKSIELDGIIVSHSDGVKKIKTLDLPQELVDKYKLNSVETKEKLQQLKDQQERHLKNIQNLQLLRMVNGEVLQVLDNGLLIEINEFFMFEEGYKKSSNINFKPIRRARDQIIFLEYSDRDKNIQWVDGSTYTGFIYSNGIFEYNNTLGVKKTIPKFNQTSKEFDVWYFKQYPIKN